MKLGKRLMLHWMKSFAKLMRMKNGGIRNAQN